ncbi:MAG: methyltransferase domain-containing protein [Rubrivivax sp.]|nr:methyltransferase domain-containing protein [Rubrivivax sp.]MDP3223763.1 methyltransferase domain-containing protein [Rubrivivax sp.]MDP3612767.1 methyltransferase domain-containing protein [Rubrivivax sp.]
MQRRLHIGGKQRRDGWEILDVNPGPLVDHQGNAIDLGQFADGSFAEVYASHVLEHFDYKDALMTALREWHRVLAPGGVLRLSVPDIDVLAHLLLQRHKLDVNQRFQVMRMIFGGHVDAHDYHLVGLNQDFLAGYLQSAGFEQLQRVPRHGLFHDTSDMVVAGVPISLNLNAFKPLRVEVSPSASPLHVDAAPAHDTATA